MKFDVSIADADAQRQTSGAIDERENLRRWRVFLHIEV